MSQLLAERRNRVTRRLRGMDIADKSSEVLRYILVCWLEGYFPTTREIAIALDYPHSNGVAIEIKKLKAAGYVQHLERYQLKLTDKSLNLVL